MEKDIKKTGEPFRALPIVGRSSIYRRPQAVSLFNEVLQLLVTCSSVTSTLSLLWERTSVNGAVSF